MSDPFPPRFTPPEPPAPTVPHVSSRTTPGQYRLLRDTRPGRRAAVLHDPHDTLNRSERHYRARRMFKQLSHNCSRVANAELQFSIHSVAHFHAAA